MAKTGVKTDHVIDPRTGEPVVGLRQFVDPVKGYTRYFTLLERGKRKQFGTSKDLRGAIAKFRMWEESQSQSRETVTLRQTIDGPDDFDPTEFERIMRRSDYVVDGDDGSYAAVTVDSPAFWNATREAYLKDPVGFSQRINMETPKSAKLADLLAWFVEDRQGKIGNDQLVATKKRWNEFLRIVKKTRACELSKPIFKRYEETIIDLQQDKGHANKWSRNRMATIRSVIYHAVKKRQLSDEDIKALQHHSVMDMPPNDDTHPVKITPKQWKALLKAAKGDKWATALFMVSLNGAYLPVDCRRLTWDRIDWDARCIKFPRQKTRTVKGKSTPRICYLWKSTIKALKALKADYRSRKITHPNVFISSQGRPCAKQTMTRTFQRLAEKAGVTGVDLRHLRHTAITAASNDPTVPDRHVDLLAGHSTGIKEHYVVPEAVRMACEAVERAYFGGNGKA